MILLSLLLRSNSEELQLYCFMEGSQSDWPKEQREDFQFLDIEGRDDDEKEKRGKQ